MAREGHRTVEGLDDAPAVLTADADGYLELFAYADDREEKAVRAAAGAALAEGGTPYARWLDLMELGEERADAMRVRRA